MPLTLQKYTMAKAIIVVSLVLTHMIQIQYLIHMEDTGIPTLLKV